MPEGPAAAADADAIGDAAGVGVGVAVGTSASFEEKPDNLEPQTNDTHTRANYRTQSLESLHICAWNVVVGAKSQDLVLIPR